MDPWFHEVPGLPQPLTDSYGPSHPLTAPHSPSQPQHGAPPKREGVRPCLFSFHFGPFPAMSQERLKWSLSPAFPWGFIAAGALCWRWPQRQHPCSPAGLWCPPVSIPCPRVPPGSGSSRSRSAAGAGPARPGLPGRSSSSAGPFPPAAACLPGLCPAEFWTRATLTHRQP